MGSVKGDAGKRRYTSLRREEGARQTRQAITRAAERLFLRDGYAATSLAAIAQEAQCSRPAVFAVFGSKFALLSPVLDEALAGDDEPVPVAQRPWFQPVWSARTSDDVCRAYAEVCTQISRRAAPMFEVVRRAADADPEARSLWEVLVTNRRAGAQMVVDQCALVSGRRRGRHLTRAVDQFWFLNDPAHYAALVDLCGWSEKAYREWLTRNFLDATATFTTGPGRPH
jgi:AcrR family transcriptional regulator